MYGCEGTDALMQAHLARIAAATVRASKPLSMSQQQEKQHLNTESVQVVLYCQCQHAI